MNIALFSQSQVVTGAVAAKPKCATTYSPGNVQTTCPELLPKIDSTIIPAAQTDNAYTPQGTTTTVNETYQYKTKAPQPYVDGKKGRNVKSDNTYQYNTDASKPVFDGNSTTTTSEGTYQYKTRAPQPYVDGKKGRSKTTNSGDTYQYNSNTAQPVVDGSSTTTTSEDTYQYKTRASQPYVDGNNGTSLTPPASFHYNRKVAPAKVASTPSTQSGYAVQSRVVTNHNDIAANDPYDGVIITKWRGNTYYNKGGRTYTAWPPTSTTQSWKTVGPLPKYSVAVPAGNIPSAPAQPATRWNNNEVKKKIVAAPSGAPAPSTASGFSEAKVYGMGIAKPVPVTIDSGVKKQVTAPVPRRKAYRYKTYSSSPASVTPDYSPPLQTTPSSGNYNGTGQAEQAVTTPPPQPVSNTPNPDNSSATLTPLRPAMVKQTTSKPARGRKPTSAVPCNCPAIGTDAANGQDAQQQNTTQQQPQNTGTPSGLRPDYKVTLAPDGKYNVTFASGNSSVTLTPFGRIASTSVPSGTGTPQYNYRGLMDNVGTLPMQYTYEGRVSSVGSTPIGYNYNGNIASIGGMPLSYNYNGTIDKIGTTKVLYDANGGVNGTSNSNPIIAMKQ
ncbi:hypothetical protein [Parasediminibacterium sp. JCM 36343]|uniref:hypothetical protein n=1 Tax=Parasediminibacterium sp. JCM 36343 TaxID=3374279 RepID=UPI00397D816C